MKNHLMGNMLNNIKNGQLAKKRTVTLPKKKNCEAILKILWNEGFILGYQTISKTTKLKIFLKYSREGKPTIKFLKILSKPGKKIYFNTKEIWKINSNKIFVIFSTTKGLKTIYECKKHKIGGEPIVIVK